MPDKERLWLFLKSFQVNGYYFTSNVQLCMLAYLARLLYVLYIFIERFLDHSFFTRVIA